MSGCEPKPKEPLEVIYIPYGEKYAYDEDDVVPDEIVEDDSELYGMPPNWSPRTIVAAKLPPLTTERDDDGEISLVNLRCQTVLTGCLLAVTLIGLLFCLMGFMECVFAKTRNHRHCFLHIYIASMGCIVHVPFINAVLVSPEQDRVLLQLLYFTTTSAQTSCAYQLLHLLAARRLSELVARMKHKTRILKINCFVIILVSIGFGVVGALVLPHSKAGVFWHEKNFIMMTFVFTYILPLVVSIFLIAFSKCRRTKPSFRVSNRVRYSPGETDTIVQESLQNPEETEPKSTMRNRKVTESTFPEAEVLFFGFIIMWGPLKILQLLYHRAQEFHECRNAVDVALMVACSFSIAMPLLQVAVRSRKQTKKTASFALREEVQSRTSGPTRSLISTAM